MKFVFWLAVNLTFSPGEKEQPLCVSGFCEYLSDKSVARISMRRKAIPLLSPSLPRPCVFTSGVNASRGSLFPARKSGTDN